MHCSERARELFEQARELDLEYADAYRGLAWVNINGYRWGWSGSLSRERSLELALEMARKGVELAPFNHRLHQALAFALTQAGRLDEALVALDQAIELNPNDASVLASISGPLLYTGRASEAVAQIERAIRLNPYHPDWYLWNLGFAQYYTGDYEKSVESFMQMKKMPNLARRQLAASYVRMGNIDEAKAVITEFLKNDSDYSIDKLRLNFKGKFTNPEDLERLIDDLRTAGLPEHPPLVLPDKPSIAVLPFDDLSPETPKKSLADGLTETLISTLGQVSDLFVIARNSVMAYKAQATDIREIGRQLGVRYVLEGSVQQTLDKVRVTAQLIDTTTAGHLWAERHDRPLDDIFLLQDEIALKVLVSLQVHLTDGEVARLRSSTTKNVDAYLLYQKGVDVFFTFTKEAMIETRRWMDEALELDPDFTSAMILKSWTHVTDAESGYTNSRDGSIALAEGELARMGNLGLELTVLARGEALMIRAYIELLRGNHDRAIEYGERSIALLPNHPDMLAIFGSFLHYVGKNKNAIEIFQNAMRVDPGYKSWYAETVSKAWVLIEDYDAAEIAARDAIERASKGGDTMLAFAHQSMAIVYTEQGKVDLGRTEIRRALELVPWLSLQSYRSSKYYRNEKDLERFIDALRAAGLPE